MRIALTYNLRLSDSEDEAEFDSEETVNAIASAIERLNHRVERFEVSGPASRTVARLEAYAPDLIFNVAEGRRGRYREAFYPALFEELGFAYTGSDPYSLSITLDKQLSKLILREQGVRTPGWQFVEKASHFKPGDLHFPVIVKPNFEGSSKGITQSSIAETLEEARAKVVQALAHYPEGVLVEEYIPGRDLAVPLLAGLPNEHGGVLHPMELVVDPIQGQGRKYAIYDYELKMKGAATPRPPTDLSPQLLEEIRKTAQDVYATLGCRDLGRIDFRLSDAGLLYFLEADALPTLEPGASLYVAAALEGLHLDAVIGTIISGAARRYKIRDGGRRTERPARRPDNSLRVGFTYNVKRIKPTADAVEDREAEYDAPTTLQAVREAIASWGHEVVDLEANSELPSLLTRANVDLVFNIAEGFKGRSRESQVPALLELLDIPYTGSDPATLAVAHDKALAKRIVRTAGIHTPDFQLMVTGKERLARELEGVFPLMAKPVAEGSSKGVLSKSVCHSEAELREGVRELVQKYQQPVLVEEYVRGREFTVGLIGERRPKVLPPMEIVFLDKSDETPVYSFQHKLDWNDRIRYDVPAKLEPTELERLKAAARGAFMALGCRDVARLDFRMDARGRISFIECNPLPGLTPGWSDLVLISQGAGMDYRTLIGEILSGAIRRLKDRRSANAPRLVPRAEPLVDPRADPRTEKIG